MRKTLLLNSSYETLSFIPLRKLIKLIVKNKVDIISSWDDDTLTWGEGKMKYPSIVRLRYFVNRKFMKVRFNRRGVFRRDHFQCQYCGVTCGADQLTLDHVVPASRGGKSTWTNALSSCLECNSKKADRTPEEAGMKPLSKPEMPTDPLVTEFMLTKPRHDDWDMYFAGRVTRVKRDDN
jgi:5-methylcytosine-specific restriction endonuclease McrA